MTTYDLVCCYKSPNWYNYRSVLDYADEYFPANVDRSLPQSVEDSYFGRAVSLAVVVNASWKTLTAETLDVLAQANQIFCKAATFGCRPWNARTKQKVLSYLQLGLPAEWLLPMLKAFQLGLWTWIAPEVQLNDPVFLEIVQELSKLDYSPIQGWFLEHPYATSSKSLYDECYTEYSKED